MGILAGLTFLRERKWRGGIEWHTDCLGAINTREKIKHHKYNHWYAQRDKDVWQRIKIEQQHWGERLTLCHVKAHMDERADHVSTPEQLCNQEMDVLAKIACKNDLVKPVGEIKPTAIWNVYMHGQHVVGHTKSYVLEQTLLDRSKQYAKTEKQKAAWGEHPQDLCFKYLLGTAPSKCNTAQEAMLVWQELPTNDKTTKWNICDDSTCQGCGEKTETNEHVMHECTQIGIKNIRQTISDTIVQAYREAGANTLLQKNNRTIVCGGHTETNNQSHSRNYANGVEGCVQK